VLEHFAILCEITVRIAPSVVDMICINQMRKYRPCCTGRHESLTYFYYIKYLMDFLIFLQCFFLVRGGKGTTKCPIVIADLVLLYNKCMEGQHPVHSLQDGCLLVVANIFALDSSISYVPSGTHFQINATIRRQLNLYVLTRLQSLCDLPMRAR
jgi:hypothetical protein